MGYQKKKDVIKLAQDPLFVVEFEVDIIWPNFYLFMLTYDNLNNINLRPNYMSQIL